jgi:hypothetical protein
MKPMLLIVTLVLSASFANANTKSVLDARAMTLKQWNPKLERRELAQASTPRKFPSRRLLTVQAIRKII